MLLLLLGLEGVVVVVVIYLLVGLLLLKFQDDPSLNVFCSSPVE